MDPWFINPSTTGSDPFFWVRPRRTQHSDQGDWPEKVTKLSFTAKMAQHPQQRRKPRNFLFTIEMVQHPKVKVQDLSQRERLRPWAPWAPSCSPKTAVASRQLRKRKRNASASTAWFSEKPTRRVNYKPKLPPEEIVVFL